MYYNSLNYTFLANLPKITKDLLIWTNKYIFSQRANQNSPHKIDVTTGKLYLNCSLSYFTVCKQNFKDKFILSWLYNMYLCYFRLTWSISREKYWTYLKWTSLFEQKSLLDGTLKIYFKKKWKYEKLRSEVKHVQADTILIYTSTDVWSPLWTFSVANSAIIPRNIFWPGVYERRLRSIFL